MIELLTGLGRTLGFSFAAGINLYATVGILGLASRYGWVSLPEQYRVFDNDLIIGAAITLYLIEFVADKIPWVDSVWDAVHTIIRPLGGALIAIQTLGDASPATETLIGLLGGTLKPWLAFTRGMVIARAGLTELRWMQQIAERLQRGYDEARRLESAR